MVVSMHVNAGRDANCAQLLSCISTTLGCSRGSISAGTPGGYHLSQTFSMGAPILYWKQHSEPRGFHGAQVRIARPPPAHRGSPPPNRRPIRPADPAPPAPPTFA